MMQGLWGFYFANDDEAEDLAAKQPLTGPAAAAPFGDPQDAYAKGTLLVPLQCRSLCQRNRTWSQV